MEVGLWVRATPGGNDWSEVRAGGEKYSALVFEQVGELGELPNVTGFVHVYVHMYPHMCSVCIKSKAPRNQKKRQKGNDRKYPRTERKMNYTDKRIKYCVKLATKLELKGRPNLTCFIPQRSERVSKPRLLSLQITAILLLFFFTNANL